MDLFEELTDEQLDAVGRGRRASATRRTASVLLEQGVPRRGRCCSSRARRRPSGRRRPQRAGGRRTPRRPGSARSRRSPRARSRSTSRPTAACRVAIVPRDAFIALALAAPLGPPQGHARDRAGDARHQRSASPAASGSTSLGTMAAGLAHELNNPAAAARRAAARSGRRRRGHQPRAARVRRERDRARRRGEAARAAAGGARRVRVARDALDALDASDAEDAMLDALEDRGIEDGVALRRAARAPSGSTRTGSTACRRSPARRRGRRWRGWPPR